MRLQGGSISDDIWSKANEKEAKGDASRSDSRRR
jgi:hypothetical protein